MSYALKTLAPPESKPSTGKEWTLEEQTAFDQIVERLKHVRDRNSEEDFIVNVRRTVLQALNKFGARRGPVIPFVSRSNPINRILGKYRHLLLGPKKIS